MVDAAELAALESSLAPLAHGAEATSVLLAFLRKLGKGSARQAFMAEHILCPPIQYAIMAERFPGEDFCVLQGDIVRTRNAYILGSRQFKNFNYAVATSTCDLTRGRRDTATLLVLEPRGQKDYADADAYNRDVGNLLSLRSTRYIYLPSLPDQPEDVLFNLVHLDRVAQATNEAINKAERIASMTLIGWRVFGALLRNIQTREGKGEAQMRDYRPA